MDLLYFLTRRLDFVQALYDGAVEPFERQKELIERGEEPYVDRRNPEDYDEPPFLAEFQEADDCAMVIGHWCLCMVQAALQTYLRDWVSPIGETNWQSSNLRSELSKKQGGSWFERYRLLFLDLGLDWEKGPVVLSNLEQLNLTRNDLIHNIDMMTTSVTRVEGHAERFPVGLFLDEMWIGLGMERIKVDGEKLRLAIRLVATFCSWLEEFRLDPHRVATD